MTSGSGSGMRVLVCGGRDFADESAVFGGLDALRQRHGRLTIIEGGATGADALARCWADRMGQGKQTFKADWRRWGLSAGPRRNQEMIDHGKPDLVVAFPGQRGTADMIRRAKAAGIEVIEPLPPSRPKFTESET